MQTLTAKRIGSLLVILVLGIFPFYASIVNDLHFLVFWLLGLLLLGCFATLQEHRFGAAPKAGLWVGCLSSSLVVGVLLYKSIIDPLHQLTSTPPSTPEQAGAYGWLPLIYVFLILYCFGLAGVTVLVSLVCSSLGGLLGLLFSTLTHAVSPPSCP